MPYHDEFEHRSRRQTDEGIRARSQRGEFVEHWWAERWIKALEQITDAGRLRRGRSYARSGQVVSLKEEKGAIHARVQGSEAKPYRVSIHLQPLSDAQWQAVFTALSTRAIFTAQLLAGEMPNEIEEAFTAARVSLLPASSAELETDCSCPDWANPCKHVAAVHYILGEQFDEDPFLIFRLRGRSREQIMAALHKQRQSEGTSAVAEDREAYQAEAAPPLAKTPAAFYQMQHPLEHFAAPIQAPTQPYPALRRLGPPAFAPGMEGSLELLYTAITQAALRVAFAAAGAPADDETDSPEP